MHEGAVAALVEERVGQDLVQHETVFDAALVVDRFGL